MITEQEYLNAQKLIIDYLKQERNYKLSVRKDLDNKVFNKGEYTIESYLFDCDISNGLRTVLYRFGMKATTKLKAFKVLTKSDILEIENMGKKRAKELEKLLWSVEIELL